MPGEISRSYDGPRDGSPLFPEWICPRCERDKSKCICRASGEANKVLADTPTNTQRDAIAAWESWAHLYEVRHPMAHALLPHDKKVFLAGYSAATAPVS